MRVAAIDLGSNTFLLLIAEVENGEIVNVIRDELRVVRLGQEVHKNRSFHPEALSRARDCLTEYKKIIHESHVEKTLAFATSAARDVTNCNEFLAIGRDLGLPIEIISGEREAQLTFGGATFDQPDKNLAVIDVGGGSTEIIGIGPEGEVCGVSTDIGSVRLTEMFISNHPVEKSEFNELCDYAQAALDPLDLNFTIEGVVAVAGTPTTLASVIQKSPFDEDKVHGFVLTHSMLEEWLGKLAAMSVTERQKLQGMDPKRADVIVAGTAILLKSMEKVGAGELTVSIRGVRYGMVIEASKSD